MIKITVTSPEALVGLAIKKHFELAMTELQTKHGGFKILPDTAKRNQAHRASQI